MIETACLQCGAERTFRFDVSAFYPRGLQDRAEQATEDHQGKKSSGRGDVLLMVGILLILSGFLFLITSDIALFLVFEGLGVLLGTAGWKLGTHTPISPATGAMDLPAGPDDALEGILDELGLTLDSSVTDPKTALLRGVIKANIVQGYKVLQEGQPASAIQILTGVIDRTGVEDLPDALSAAHYVRGCAYELQGDAMLARADYLRALEWAPDHPAAGEALERLG